MDLHDPDWRSWWTSQVIDELQAEADTAILNGHSAAILLANQ